MIEDEHLIQHAHRVIEAARAAGAQALLVRTGRGRQSEEQLSPDPDLFIADDLAHAVEHLIHTLP